jgi:hypothetical protein
VEFNYGSGCCSESVDYLHLLVASSDCAHCPPEIGSHRFTAATTTTSSHRSCCGKSSLSSGSPRFVSSRCLGFSGLGLAGTSAAVGELRGRHLFPPVSWCRASIVTLPSSSVCRSWLVLT